MGFETVDYAFDGRVATVTMNRPEALNAQRILAQRDEHHDADGHREQQRQDR